LPCQKLNGGVADENCCCKEPQIVRRDIKKNLRNKKEKLHRLTILKQPENQSGCFFAAAGRQIPTTGGIVVFAGLPRSVWVLVLGRITPAKFL
jgi:hypothetical protein